jgi:curli biogenesis system outer membrane secretion channel CsgG
MKIFVIALAAGTLGLAACSTTVAETSGAPPVTKTVTPAAPRAPVTQAPVTQAPVTQGPAARPPASAAAAQPVPSVTDPWAVVSAYYGDVESGDYAQAWALLSSGMVTGQTYQQFVSGFSCTGAQQPTEQGESGDQVTFDLAATDNCSGAVQTFTGTDTVTDGKIVAAQISRTG